MKCNKISALIFLFGSLIGSSASAQTIYKCEQEGGGYNFSEYPCPEQVTLQEEPQKVWHELKALTEKGMNIGQLVGADIESIKQCHRDKAAYLKSLELIKPRIDALLSEYEEFADAYDQLEACAICRPSGVTYCKKAKKYLDQVTVKLQ